MWIFIKIAVAVAAFLVRFFAKHFHFLHKASARSIQFEDMTCYIQTPKSKNGKVMATSFLVPFHCKFTFKLTSESGTDRYFKKLGIAKEIQSGDSEFDQKIYIACDSNAFAHKITKESEPRRLILDLFNAGCTNIRCNGSYLIVDFKDDRSLESSLGKNTIQLCRQIFDMSYITSRFQVDSFALRTLMIEASIWSIAAYAVTAVISFFITREDVHLNTHKLAIHGLTFGLVLTGALLGAVAFLMKGSSRGHRIIVESVLVLLLTLPVAGIGMVADQNVELDNKTPVTIQRKIQDMQIQTHKRRKGGTYYTYHIYLYPAQGTEQIPVPEHIQVSRDVYERGQVSDTLEIEIGQGWLNHPWYKSFTYER